MSMGRTSSFRNGAGDNSRHLWVPPVSRPSRPYKDTTLDPHNPDGPVKPNNIYDTRSAEDQVLDPWDDDSTFWQTGKD